MRNQSAGKPSALQTHQANEFLQVPNPDHYSAWYAIYLERALILIYTRDPASPEMNLTLTQNMLAMTHNRYDSVDQTSRERFDLDPVGPNRFNRRFA